MISALTPGTNNAFSSDSGIARNHVYTVLDVHEVEGEKLLRIRNPWGVETYGGQWSDDDTSTWDQVLQGTATTFRDHFSELNEFENDGIFFIDYVTYHQEF